MTALFAVIAAALVAVVLIPPLGWLAVRLHVLDLPSGRKVHERPIPRLGGLAMAIGAVVPLMMWAPMQPGVVAFLIGVAVILIFGVWDDMSGLDYRLKFLGQIIAVLVVVLYGDVVIRHLPFRGLEPLPDYLAVPLTVFVLVGVTNAINLADGLDGLAGGITLLSLVTVAVLAYMADDATLALISMSVVGSIMGFLRFNTYPARMFMGDCGSQFLGFSAGFLVITLTQESCTALSPALPLLIVGLPILDTTMVVFQRLSEGRSPFSSDKNHLHHKLLTHGFAHHEAVLIIYVLQALLVVAALLLRFEADWLIVSVYLAFCIALVVSLRMAMFKGWQVHDGHSAAGVHPLPRWIQWLRRDQRPLKIAFYVAWIATTSYVLVGAFFVEKVPTDIGVLACSLLIVLLAMFIGKHHKPLNTAERASVYIAGICVVYLIQVSPGHLVGFIGYRDALVAAMAVSVVIGFRVSSERFRITPTDFIVLALALLVPSIPELNRQLDYVGKGIAMLVVFFYAIELVLSNINRHWNIMRITTYGTLVVLALRGLAGRLG